MSYDMELKLMMALTRAYALMLKVPATDILRIENQETYAAVRDAIASASNMTPQEVQEGFEEDELKERLG